MSHWIVAPVVLPTLAAVLLLFLGGNVRLQRSVSVLATLALLVVSVRLVLGADVGGTEVYFLGNWPAPFGIVLVLDRLSALMVLLVSVVGVLSLTHAMQGWDCRGRNFYPLFQFQLMGINGAFLTGDLFNLFVFFEVLLIASYGLLLYAGDAPRLRAGFKYVVLNLIGSAFFLVATAVLYGLTGTLNMADLAVRLPLLGPEDAGLARAAGLLLLVVFGVKAALVPLHVWLPSTYGSAPGPVAALFAVMTKVGAYCILRVFFLAFGPEAGVVADLVLPWLLPAALATLMVGAIGALGTGTLPRLAAFLVLASAGTPLVAFGVGTADAIAGGLYYLVHSTVIGAGMFLLADLIVRQRPEAGARLIPDAPFAGSGLLSVLFFVSAIAVVGVPPLSGFLGKFMILQAASAEAAPPVVAWVWATVLVSSLAMLAAASRGGVLVFWANTKAPEGQVQGQPAPSPAEMAPLIGAIGLTVLLTVFAEPVKGYMDRAAAQTLDRDTYVHAVLGEDLARSFEPTGVYYDDHSGGYGDEPAVLDPEAVQPGAADPDAVDPGAPDAPADGADPADAASDGAAE